MTPDQLLSSLQFRYATKQFEPDRKIPAESWSALEQSLLLSPSSFGLQPWKFLVIANPDLRERLKAVSWGQTQVTEASHFVVFVTRTEFADADLDRFMACLATAQGSEVESLKGYREVIARFGHAMTPEEAFSWNSHQCYLALGQFMASAACLEIDTCPMEGLDAPSYDEILSLSGTGYRTIFACAAGYRHENDKYALMPKARYPLGEVVQHL